jgi:hypothetical protein
VISGHVTDIVDVDEFRLADSSGSVRVYVGSQKRVAVGVGDLVTVTGMLDDVPRRSPRSSTPTRWCFLTGP